MRSFRAVAIFLFSMALAALGWAIAALFLVKVPQVSTPMVLQKEYFHIDLARLFFTNSSAAPRIAAVPKLQITLKAVYNNGKNGFIVIEDRGKTHFVDLNATYRGYKLIKIYPDSAIFIKGGKKYRVTFPKSRTSHTLPNVGYKQVISKKTLKKYTSNIKEIFRNIGIVKDTQGYLVTFVKPGSIFDTMGLKKGDILLEVNGRVLHSDADAWDLYKNIDTFDHFEVTVLRNNQQKVLQYEVD